MTCLLSALLSEVYVRAWWKYAVGVGQHHIRSQRTMLMVYIMGFFCRPVAWGKGNEASGWGNDCCCISSWKNHCGPCSSVCCAWEKTEPVPGDLAGLLEFCPDSCHLVQCSLLAEKELKIMPWKFHQVLTSFLLFQSCLKEKLVSTFACFSLKLAMPLVSFSVTT